MKSIVRSYVYWPHIDRDIQQYVQKYNHCAQTAKTANQGSTGQCYQALGPESTLILQARYIILTTFLQQMRIANGPKSLTHEAQLPTLQFPLLKSYSHATDFPKPSSVITVHNSLIEHSRNFVKSGIQYVRTAPFYPQSNGLMERFVDTFKRSLKKLTQGEKTMSRRQIQMFLTNYRTTPNRSAQDGKSPAELMFERSLRTILHLLKPPSNQTSSEFVTSHSSQTWYNRKHGSTRRVNMYITKGTL